jgi:hypothetical protein
VVLFCSVVEVLLDERLRRERLPVVELPVVLCPMESLVVLFGELIWSLLPVVD